MKDYSVWLGKTVMPLVLKVPSFIMTNVRICLKYIFQNFGCLAAVKFNSAKNRDRLDAGYFDT